MKKKTYVTPKMTFDNKITEYNAGLVVVVVVAAWTLVG